jgi:hypothetical protein
VFFLYLASVRVDELLVFLHLWCKYCRLAANLNFDYKSLLCRVMVVNLVVL